MHCGTQGPGVIQRLRAVPQSSTKEPRKMRSTPYLPVLLLMTVFSSPLSVGLDSSPPMLKIYLFASSTCPGCSEITKGLFPELKKRFGERVAFEHVVLDDIENFKLLLCYEERYGVDDDEALKVFLGDGFLSGRKAIFTELESMIVDQLDRGAVTLSPGQVRIAENEDATAAPASEGTLIRDRFAGFRPAAVAAAGLIDGLNPCAFTTIVFFVSLLAALKKSRRDILIVGLCFALSVFLTYLFLGFGALKAIKIFSVTSGISTVITVAVALLTFVLAGMNFLDYVRYRRTGRADDIQLKLPHAIRLRVNRVISKHMRTRNLAVGALSLGVIVSLLESLCTGQVYLPTLVFIMRNSSLAPRAFVWIVMYNLMFVMPLVAVFGLAYAGISSQRMLRFSKKHIGASKLLLGLLFLGLGTLLFFTAM